MQFCKCTALGGMSLLALAAQAQSAAPAPAATAEAVHVDEIIVSARRRDESIRDVPQTINAVTAAEIDKLNLRNFTDVSAVIPGISFTTNNSFSSGASVRGVTFIPEASGNNPTVEFYLNDAPIASSFLFQSMFDVGQVELQRGPQGTLRGRAAPSGAMTVSTRKPDLSGLGAVVNGTATDTDAYKIDGAINLPIIPNILAVRIAAVYDKSEANRVSSIKQESDPAHNFDPRRETKAYRASVLFEPADFLSVGLLYQNLETNNRQYVQVVSQSEVTGAAISTPLIRAKDRMSNEDQGSWTRQKQEVFIWNGDLRLFGQKLSYVGSQNSARYYSMGPSDTSDLFKPPAFPIAERTFTDPANRPANCQRLGRDMGLQPTNQTYFQCTDAQPTRTTHELRLSSDERVAGMFDYIVGYLHDQNNTPTNLTQETPLLVSPTRLASINLTAVQRGGNSTENSFFGNITAHIGEAFEVSGGMRHINYKAHSSILVDGAKPSADIEDDLSQNIFQGTARYRFSDSLMVYGSVGTSWRPGPRAVGNFSVRISDREKSFLNLDPETSTSYEGGVRASFLDNRAYVSVSAYHQDFKNYVYRSQPVFYINYRQLAPNFVAPQVASFNYLAGVPVKVDGVEAEMSFRILPNWSFGGNLAYANGRITNGTIPCNDLNGDNVPDQNPITPGVTQLQAAVGAGQNMAQCTGYNGKSSFANPWSLNAQTEYSFDLNDRFGGFVRGLATINPANKADPTDDFDNAPGYTLINLYGGLRSADNGWELTVYGKNIFNVQKILSTSSTPLTNSLTQLLFGPGGSVVGTTSYTNVSQYYGVNSYTPEREIGVTLRVAFGTR